MSAIMKKKFVQYAVAFVVPVVCFSCLFLYSTMRSNDKGAMDYLGGVQKQLCNEFDLLYSSFAKYRAAYVGQRSGAGMG